MKKVLIILLILVSLICVGFGTNFQQSVYGTVKSNGKPLSGVSLKFVQGTEPNTCSAAIGEIVETDQNGKFKTTITANRSTLAVIVQPLKMCEKEGDTWRVAWESLHGPAPNEIEFNCIKEFNIPTECTTKFNYKK